MSVLQKARTAITLLRQGNFHVIFLKLGLRFKLPQTVQAAWRAGIKHEIDFWDRYFLTKGLQWSDTYGRRFDPDLPLQPRCTALLPPSQKEVCILDVGAGPLTYLGKKCAGKNLSIIAVDPLADEYDKILQKHNIEPLIRTKSLSAERLTEMFPSNTFDLVFARNCIDHAYDPEKAILQMIDVVKRNSYVLLEHRPNEADSQNHQGLHHWNFSVSSEGDFLISSKSKQLNVTKKYKEICSISCEILSFGENEEWLITRIQKI